MAGAGLSKIVIAFGQALSIWIRSILFVFQFPILGSSREAIWLAKVAPEVQGRVFATRGVIVQLASALGLLIAGPLADRVFEPAMQPGGFLAAIFGPIIGTGAGAGMALLYGISALGLLLVAVGGYACRLLRDD